MANPKKNRRIVSKKKSSSKEQNNTTQGNDSEKMTTVAISPGIKPFKVKLSIKFAVIMLSVLALSLFFEGCRQIKEGITLEHIAVLIGGTLFTAILLLLQAFWIYLEEKYKGTLRRKNAHFEKAEEYWNAKVKRLGK